LTHETRDDVIPATGGKPNNPMHRPRRIVERRCNSRESRQRGAGAGNVCGEVSWRPPGVKAGPGYLRLPWMQKGATQTKLRLQKFAVSNSIQTRLGHRPSLPTHDTLSCECHVHFWGPPCSKQIQTKTKKAPAVKRTLPRACLRCKPMIRRRQSPYCRL
jgi:hypothetical protein